MSSFVGLAAVRYHFYPKVIPPIATASTDPSSKATPHTPTKTGTPTPTEKVTYSGFVVPPMDTGSAGLERCKYSLDEAGRNLNRFHAEKERYPDALSEVFAEPPHCPVTRQPYGWIRLPEFALIYCSDSPHIDAGKRLRPAYECVSKKGFADWAPGDKGPELYANIFLCSSEGDMAKALQAALKYIETPEATLEGWITALELDGKLGGAQGASLRARFQEKFPDEPRVVEGLVSSLRCAGQYKEARALAEKGLETVKDRAYLETELAFMAFSDGQYEEALKHLERDPANRPWAGAQILFAQRKFKLTLDWCRSSLEKVGWTHYASPYLVELACLSGQALGGEDEKQAQANLRQGLEKCPQIWPFPVLLYLNGELDGAQLLAAARDSVERTSEAHACLGFKAALVNKDAEARGHFEKVAPAYWEKPMTAAWLKKL